MADSKLSALTAKATLDGSEETYINDGGTSKKATLSAVNTYVGLTYKAKTATITAVTTTATPAAANEVRKHLVTALGDITIAAADVGPSMMLLGNIKLKSTSTIGSSLIAYMSHGIHYQVGPRGTVSEFS